VARPPGGVNDLWFLQYFVTDWWLSYRKDIATYSDRFFSGTSRVRKQGTV